MMMKEWLKPSPHHAEEIMALLEKIMAEINAPEGL
jgi:quinol monooxygenase YgiN